MHPQIFQKRGPEDPQIWKRGYISVVSTSECKDTEFQSYLGKFRSCKDDKNMFKIAF